MIRHKRYLPLNISRH
uniref:Uncharacterized protein n=1 Tax=Lepeophtheirus salmonis TaxID=72036 RepID=A0A0K2V3D2_LEPSM